MIDAAQIEEWSLGRQRVIIWPDGAWSDGTILLGPERIDLPESFLEIAGQAPGDYVLRKGNWRFHGEVVVADWEELVPDQKAQEEYDHLGEMKCNYGVSMRWGDDGVMVPLTTHENGLVWNVDISYWDVLRRERIDIRGWKHDLPLILEKNRRVVGLLMP